MVHAVRWAKSLAMVLVSINRRIQTTAVHVAQSVHRASVCMVTVAVQKARIAHQAKSAPMASALHVHQDKQIVMVPVSTHKVTPTTAVRVVRSVPMERPVPMAPARVPKTASVQLGNTAPMASASVVPQGRHFAMVSASPSRTIPITAVPVAKFAQVGKPVSMELVAAVPLVHVVPV